MKFLISRYIWLAIALISAGLVVGSLMLVAWLKLQPCPLCIFQRLLFMIMSILAFLAFVGTRHAMGKTAGVLTLLTAIAGAGVAGYQVWLQAQPAAMFTCGAGDPTLIERMVDWLGQQIPFLFLATGVCQDKALLILGFSLAAWALAIFTASAVAALYALTVIMRRSATTR
jgi:disulfide bond formation protein DsbB